MLRLVSDWPLFPQDQLYIPQNASGRIALSSANEYPSGVAYSPNPKNIGWSHNGCPEGGLGLLCEDCRSCVQVCGERQPCDIWNQHGCDVASSCSPCHPCHRSHQSEHGDDDGECCPAQSQGEEERRPDGVKDELGAVERQEPSTPLCVGFILASGDERPLRCDSHQ